MPLDFYCCTREDVAMNILPKVTLRIIKNLRAAGVDPILYGSQGVSLFIGNFKEFGDIDLLVDQRWMANDWENLVVIMSKIGFELHDLHEHDFVNVEDLHVSFASKEILIRDGITSSLKDSTTTFLINSTSIKTLKPKVFKRAYEFSEQDGYRKKTRGKKDQIVIALLIEYLNESS